MKTKLLIVLTAILLGLSIVWATNSFSQAKYNPYENRWEIVPDGYTMQYNPHENKFEYQHPRATQQYNPYENRFEMVPPPVNHPGTYNMPAIPNPYNQPIYK